MRFRKVIGLHACKEALKARSSKEIEKVYLKTGWEQSPVLRDLAEMAKSKNIVPEYLSEKKMRQIGEAHQGICVVTSGQPCLNKKSFGPNSVVLILDRVQDPKNLGAIIRTAWLMSVDALFMSSRRSAALSPYVAKAASGGLEYVPIELNDNLHQCIKELKQEGFWIYAMDTHSTNNLWNERFEGRTAFVFGGEKSGVRKGVNKQCDKTLSVSQKNKSASYNVSVTVGITLGECFRQRFFHV